jgi:hypothetical protein
MSDQDASLLMEERKLHYLNRSANAQTKEQRAAIEEEFADVIAFMMGETATLSALVRAPKQKATASNEPRDAAEAAASYGALAVALAGLEASTDEELATIIGEAGTLFIQRNPSATPAELVAMLGLPAPAEAPVVEKVGEEFFLAEEAGAYQNPDQSIVKFATGDKLFLNADGVMTVSPYIPDNAMSLNWQDMSKLAKALGSSARSKGAVETFVAEKLKERQDIVANVADPE